jgi:hypothetical protein
MQAFEHHSESLLSFGAFLMRLAKSFGLVLSLISASLFVGMLGYHGLEGLSWIDSFLNASMLLGGMGPVNNPQTFAGKLFAGSYALFCGLLVIVLAGILIAPVAHRFLHKFHLQNTKT